MATKLIILLCAVVVAVVPAQGCGVCGDPSHKPDGAMLQKMFKKFMMTFQSQMNTGGGSDYSVDYEEKIRREREQQEMEAEKIQEKFEAMLVKFQKQKKHYATTMLGELVTSCQCMDTVLTRSPAWVTATFMSEAKSDLLAVDWEPDSGEALKKHFFAALFSQLCSQVNTFLVRTNTIATAVENLIAGGRK